MTLRTDWLRLVKTPQRAALVRLLETASRSREQQANTMLVAAPLPTDETDAQARAMAVIRYLAREYRVGDPHQTTEEAHHE